MQWLRLGFSLWAVGRCVESYIMIYSGCLYKGLSCSGAVTFWQRRSRLGADGRITAVGMDWREHSYSPSELPLSALFWEIKMLFSVYCMMQVSGLDSTDPSTICCQDTSRWQEWDKKPARVVCISVSLVIPISLSGGCKLSQGMELDLKKLSPSKGYFCVVHSPCPPSCYRSSKRTIDTPLASNTGMQSTSVSLNDIASVDACHSLHNPSLWILKPKSLLSQLEEEMWKTEANS